jgi:hypothetical protein
MTKKITIVAFIFALAFVALLSSGKTSLAAENYNPQINPADFSTTINNPYFTLTPGTTFIYQNNTEDGIETNKMVVTNLTREVMGVKTLVVWDRVWLNNNLIEETYDWYAQDKMGNVWYFGEESREYENSKVKSTHGSWETGIDGAKPGIIMKASPQVGDSYRQEYYQGEAEDMSDILALNESVTTPYGSFKNCLKTKDWTPLEPDKIENKYFCSDIGQMTVAISLATSEKDELVDVQKNTDFVGLTDIKDIRNEDATDLDKNGDKEDVDKGWFQNNDNEKNEEGGQEEEEEWPLTVGIGFGGLLAGLAIGRYKDIFTLFRKKQISSNKKDSE